MAHLFDSLHPLLFKAVEAHSEYAPLLKTKPMDVAGIFALILKCAKGSEASIAKRAIVYETEFKNFVFDPTKTTCENIATFNNVIEYASSQFNINLGSDETLRLIFYNAIENHPTLNEYYKTEIVKADKKKTSKFKGSTSRYSKPFIGSRT